MDQRRWSFDCELGLDADLIMLALATREPRLSATRRLPDVSETRPRTRVPQARAALLHRARGAAAGRARAAPLGGRSVLRAAASARASRVPDEGARRRLRLERRAARLSAAPRDRRLCLSVLLRRQRLSAAHARARDPGRRDRRDDRPLQARDLAARARRLHYRRRRGVAASRRGAGPRPRRVRAARLRVARVAGGAREAGGG